MICGVDEVGRGPLAGPVVSAAVILSKPIEGLSDSKKLTENKRLRLFSLITSSADAWSYATASSAEIDQINIRQASLLAMKRAVDSLLQSPTHVLVDGRDTIDVCYPCPAVIKGDQKEPAIMAASIIAKCIRDEMMRMLAVMHPQYGFERHFGYPTKHHCDMLLQHGVTKHHRMSFKPCSIL